MATPILATKLFAPPLRPKIVLRPRLIERLNEGLAMGCKLTLIAAPAGFGKTTLVSEWITRCDRPVAWLSLDAGDNDPIRFVTYLLEAIQAIKPGIGMGARAALQSSQTPLAEAALTALLNDLTSDPDGMVLILDDYHAIEAKQVDDAIEFLLEYLPAQVHLVISTREDLRLPLARLRAQGRLIELRAADLRFSGGECAEFLNCVMGLKLADEDIAALEARTEGWIAGLQMAAISMQGHDDAAGFIRSLTGSHRFVLDYLIEEVLQRQSEQIQSFLLHTSILDRMCGPLCDAVLMDATLSSQAVLEHLEHANLFIVPLDNERRWYRYHHLFRDLLRLRLDQRPKLPDYHLRASAWFETHADFSQAFQHAHAAGDFERAARLAEAAWHDMERSFHTLSWLGWVKRLPDAAVESRPQLCIQIGRAYSDVGEPKQSEAYLQRAERALTGVKNATGNESIPANIALIRASNAQIEGDLAETVRLTELTLQLAPERDLFLRAQAAITLGFTQWVTGSVEASLQAMRTWMNDMKSLGNHMYMIASTFVVADMQVALGRLSEAGAALQQTIELAAAQGQEAESVTAHHHLGLAMLAHEQGEDAAFAEFWQTAARLGQHSTLIDWPYRWHLAQARLKESDGQWDTALDLLDTAGRVYVKNPIPTLQPIKTRKARIYLKQDRLDKAKDWARERGLSAWDAVSYLAEYDLLTLARIRIAEGAASGIQELLGRLLVFAESQQRAGSAVEILVTQALAHRAQNNISEAFAALERALALTAPERWVRVFTDEGAAMQSLISGFRPTLSTSAHPLRGHVDRILGCFQRNEQAAPRSPLKATPAGRMVSVYRVVAEKANDR